MATWREIAAEFPDFVQWVITQYGKVSPDVEIDPAQLNQYKFAYDVYVDRGSSDITEIEPEVEGEVL